MGAQRGIEGAGEYRAVQAMFRKGRYAEALERALAFVAQPRIGLQHAARFHSLICAIHVTGLQRGSPTATLHGEEAIRLADRIRNPWIKGEALMHLVQAHLLTRDFGRADQCLDLLEQEADQHGDVLMGGKAALLYCKALIVAQRDRLAESIALLEQAESRVVGTVPDLVARIRTLRVHVLLRAGRLAEARRCLRSGLPESDRDDSLVVAWSLSWVRLRLMEGEPDEADQMLREVAVRVSGWPAICVEITALQAAITLAKRQPGAHRLARLVVERAIAIGRPDLARSYRKQFAPLLRSPEPEDHQGWHNRC